MRLVPGMFVKFADTDTKALVVYSDGGSGVWLKEEGGSVYRAEHPDSWVFTGELDWSMTPPLPIEYSFPTDPQWRKGTKVGYLPDMGFYIRRDNGGFTWMSPKYVRMSQPEPEIKEMPAINFETDPPKYGDEYIRRDGDIVKFIGIGFISEDKWIFENSVGSLGHYYSNGMYVRSCPDVDDIVSRKPSEPIKHKEKFWVNIYAKNSCINDSLLCHEKSQCDDLRYAECLACKEIEIEWEEGEGL